MSISTFLTIPLGEIKEFLFYYRLPYDHEKAYDTVRTCITEHQQIHLSSTYLKDFVTAYNLQGKITQRYQTSYLLSSPERELVSLADSLGLSQIDKERIIRIISYLDLLDNDLSVFDRLPEDALWLIGMTLDYQTLGLYCCISQRFNKLFGETGKIVEMVRSKLQKETLLDLSSFTKKELVAKSQIGRTPMISSRANYSLVLNSRGQVFGFGFNHHGQLGTGDKKNREIPTLNEMLGTHKIISMVAAENHSIFITSQIQVIKCGGEPSRSLKILKNQEFLTVTGGRNSRIAMPSIPGKVIAISMGMGDFFLILNSLSQVFSFGANGSGCMGVGDKEPRKNPTRIGVTDIVALSAGESHSLFLNSKGQVFSCGSNGAGQLGLGDHRERLSPVLIDTSPLGEMRAISAGRDFSLILNADGQVFSFGSNNIRQLGLGDNKDRNLPTLIKGTGIDATNQIGQVVAITVGNYHSSIMNTQGQVFSFGYNTFGQLGLGDNISRNIPTLVMNIFD